MAVGIGIELDSGGAPVPGAVSAGTVPGRRRSLRLPRSPKMLAGLGKATLTPYVGDPSDVADLVLFLASDEARYITGQMIAIDGGMSAHVRTGDG